MSKPSPIIRRRRRTARRARARWRHGALNRAPRLWARLFSFPERAAAGATMPQSLGSKPFSMQLAVVPCNTLHRLSGGRAVMLVINAIKGW